MKPGLGQRKSKDYFSFEYYETQRREGHIGGGQFAMFVLQSRFVIHRYKSVFVGGFGDKSTFG